MKNRIVLATALSIVLMTLASTANAKCVIIEKVKYCEVQPTEPVALPAIPYPPAPPTVVVVQQPQQVQPPPCPPPWGWMWVGNGYNCQPPVQQVPVQTANGPSWGELAVGALVVGAVAHSFRGHDVVYVGHRGGRRHW